MIVINVSGLELFLTDSVRAFPVRLGHLGVDFNIAFKIFAYWVSIL